jgi:hypothetical protein
MNYQIWQVGIFGRRKLIAEGQLHDIHICNDPTHKYLNRHKDIGRLIEDLKYKYEQRIDKNHYEFYLKTDGSSVWEVFRI